MLAALLLWTAARAATTQPAPLPDSDALYRRICERYRPMYEKYLGVEDRSRVETRLYNSKTRELKESSQLLTHGRNYFYRKPERQVLQYFKDGVEADPGEADRREASEPMYPIWDAQGPERYRVRVVGREELRGQPCYVLRVEPRQRTARHFEGQVKVHAETLDLLELDGHMADLPWGVDLARFKLVFRPGGEIALHESFEMEAQADIPLLYPDLRVVSTSQVLESRPIPR